MEFKNKIELDLHIDCKNLDYRSDYEMSPKLVLKIYSREDKYDSWRLSQTLELHEIQDIDNLNRLYLDECEELIKKEKKREEIAPITSSDPDDIPF